MRPALSVIIPCTRPAAVRDCLAGFNEQSRPGIFEVIVVGDIEKLDSAGYNFSLTLVPCAEGHPNHRRNIGLRIAAAPLIGFLDDDTVPDKDWVNAALAACLPEGNSIVTGPEVPKKTGRISRLVYAVSINYFSEATRAHVTRERASIGWRDVPFCNCVVPAHFFRAVGPLNSDIPWDMDDFVFFNGVRHQAVFMNVPELGIKHDRYPDEIGGFLKYKWRLRVRTGEKLVSHPGIYCRIAPLLLAGTLPWLVLFAAFVSPAAALLTIGVIAVVYALLLVAQFKKASEYGFRTGMLYMGILFSLHCLSGLGIQAGILRAIYQKLRAKPLSAAHSR